MKISVPNPSKPKSLLPMTITVETMEELIVTYHKLCFLGMGNDTWKDWLKKADPKHRYNPRVAQAMREEVQKLVVAPYDIDAS